VCVCVYCVYIAYVYVCIYIRMYVYTYVCIYTISIILRHGRRRRGRPSEGSTCAIHSLTRRYAKSAGSQ
jgi:hypothetical protein